MWYDPRPVRRLCRILINALTVLSLLLWVVVCALWVRSYWRGDGVNVWNRNHAAGMESRAGYLCPMVSNLYGETPGAVYWSFPIGRLSDERRGRRAMAVGSFMGFTYYEDSRPGSGISLVAEVESAGLKVPQGVVQRQWLSIPYWAVCMVAAVPGVLALRRRKRLSRMRAAGHCPACGYDLRATPERCPECGTKTAIEGGPHCRTANAQFAE